MQLAQTCMSLFLTHIKLVKPVQDGHTLLKESIDTFKIDKIKSERSQNDYNLHVANINILEFACYTHITGKILPGWTQTAERMT